MNQKQKQRTTMVSDKIQYLFFNPQGGSAMGIYSFRIPSFRIFEVRSAHSDMLFAATSLKVMNANGSLHRDLGAKNMFAGERKAGGGVDLNMSWENIYVPGPTRENPDGGSIAWAFILANKQHSDSGWTAALNKGADALAGALAGKTLEAAELGPAGVVGFAALTAAVIALQEVGNLLNADCDGPVALGAFQKTAAELANLTATPNSAFDRIESNPGSDSPAGCGANSNYEMKYQITHVEPLLLGKALQDLGLTGLGAGLKNRIAASGTSIGANFSLRDFIGH
jgi:hypothetical protein